MDDIKCRIIKWNDGVNDGHCVNLKEENVHNHNCDDTKNMFNEPFEISFRHFRKILRSIRETTIISTIKFIIFPFFNVLNGDLKRWIVSPMLLVFLHFIIFI